MVTAAQQADEHTARPISACWGALRILMLRNPPMTEPTIKEENVVPLKPIEGCVISQSEYEAYVAALDDIRSAIDRAERVVRGIRFGNRGDAA
jgi:hypothetical protein